MPWCDVTFRPIDTAALLRRVEAPGNGAVALFLGTVRNLNDGRPVRAVEYEGYAEMASRELSGIVSEAAGRVGTDRVAAVHRLGELEVGEVSVAIAVSSPHRADAFDAARHVIEEVKRRLPIWKRERYEDGRAEWLAGTRPPTRAAAAPPSAPPGAGRP